MGHHDQRLFLYRALEHVADDRAPRVAQPAVVVARAEVDADERLPAPAALRVKGDGPPRPVRRVHVGEPGKLLVRRRHLPLQRHGVHVAPPLGRLGHGADLLLVQAHVLLQPRRVRLREQVQPLARGLHAAVPLAPPRPHAECQRRHRGRQRHHHGQGRAHGRAPVHAQQAAHAGHQQQRLHGQGADEPVERLLEKEHGGRVAPHAQDGPVGQEEDGNAQHGPVHQLRHERARVPAAHQVTDDERLDREDDPPVRVPPREHGVHRGDGGRQRALPRAQRHGRQQVRHAAEHQVGARRKRHGLQVQQQPGDAQQQGRRPAVAGGERGRFSLHAVRPLSPAGDTRRARRIPPRRGPETRLRRGAVGGAPPCTLRSGTVESWPGLRVSGDRNRVRRKRLPAPIACHPPRSSSVIRPAAPAAR